RGAAPAPPAPAAAGCPPPSAPRPGGRPGQARGGGRLDLHPAGAVWPEKRGAAFWPPLSWWCLALLAGRLRLLVRDDLRDDLLGHERLLGGHRRRVLGADRLVAGGAGRAGGVGEGRRPVRPRAGGAGPLTGGWGPDRVV